LPRLAALSQALVVKSARWGFAAVLAASAIWIAAAPRADQPLLDGIERMYPALRALYMDEKSLALVADAEGDQARYRVEAEKLRAREAAPGDALEAARIAAVLKSYDEMIGSDGVRVHALVARERESRRGWIALVLAIAALAVAPWRPRRWRAPAGAPPGTP
jgi:zinc/manganese transport system permease protein